MLYLIGLGFELKDISLRGLEAAKKCDCYCEFYTSKWNGSIQELQSLLGKEVRELKRKSLEEDLHFLIREAKQKDVAVLVPGDPLAATTHIEIVSEAKTHKIKYEVIHGVSIFSAVGELGLQLYKYGKTATVPFSGKLENVADAVKTNKKAGLHTLLLLDLDADVNLYMSPKEGIKILLEKKVLKPVDQLVAANIGGEAVYDSAKNLLKRDIKMPAVLVLPGRLHFREKEFLEQL